MLAGALGPAMTQQSGGLMNIASRPSLIDTLRSRKATLEDDLKRVNAALSALESAPGVAEALEAVSRAIW